MFDTLRPRHFFVIGLPLFVLCVTAGLLLAGDSEPADQAETLPDAVESGDAEGRVPLDSRAEIIAMSCAACHGTDGRKATAIPALAGKPAPVLEALLLAYKRDQMPDATVMPRLAKGYTDEELASVAEYFSALSPE